MGRSKELKTALDWANEYVKRAWPVLPCFRASANGDCTCPPRHKSRLQEGGSYGACKSPGKHPITADGLKSACTDIAQIKSWFAEECNIAIRTGTNRHGILVVIDIDQGDGKPGAQTLRTLEAKYGELPDTLVARTGSGGRHYVFWAPEGAKIKSRSNILRAEAGLDTKSKTGIDVRAENGYIIASPSNHAKGAYSWVNWGASIAALPEWLVTALTESVRPVPVTAPAGLPIPRTEANDLRPDEKCERLTAKQVTELLFFISPNEYDDWMMFGHVLKTIRDWIGGDEAAFQIFDTWCRQWPLYRERAAAQQRSKWETAFDTVSLFPIGLLKKHAKAGGWTPSPEFLREDRGWRIDAARAMVDALSATASSDDVRSVLAMVAKLPQIDRDPFLKDMKNKTGNRFSIGSMRDEMTAFQRSSAPDQEDLGVIVAHQVLHKHFGNGKLLIRSIDKAFWRYNGWYWEPVKNDDEVRKLCVEQTLALGAIDATVNSVSQQALDLLEAMQALPGDPLRLTQPPPPVINCRNGELWINDDLSLDLRPHQPESYLRYGINIEYDPQAECPLFDKALRDIFQDAGTEETRPRAVEDMCRHMLEIIGYAIQPRRHYKLYLIFYGRGNNGKSKLVEVITALITEDCVHAGRIGKLESSEYLIAHLCNKLLFVDDDVDSNTVLPDGILKKISESKLIQGRDPYGKPREFKVSVVPMLLANNYPYSKDLSRGTQIRAHVVPFAHEFREGKDLDRKLFDRIIRTELAGILNRAIDGLKRLETRGGFKEPADCLKAKAEFMASANPLVAFIEQECQSVEQRRNQIECRLNLDLEQHSKSRNGRPIAGVTPLTPGQLREQANVELAKLEKDGIEQTTQEFYERFKAWCEREGINWKPRKSDVERDLVHAGFYVGPGSYQKVVRGLMAREPAM